MGGTWKCVVQHWSSVLMHSQYTTVCYSLVYCRIEGLYDLSVGDIGSAWASIVSSSGVNRNSIFGSNSNNRQACNNKRNLRIDNWETQPSKNVLVLFITNSKTPYHSFPAVFVQNPCSLHFKLCVPLHLGKARNIRLVIPFNVELVAIFDCAKVLMRENEQIYD
jgi:hypothetical protein